MPDNSIGGAHLLRRIHRIRRHSRRVHPRVLRAPALIAATALLLTAACTGGTGNGTGTHDRADARPKDAAPGGKAPAPELPASLTGQEPDWTVCPEPSAAQGGGDAPGKGWECATLKAPVDYLKPGGRTLDVALIRKKATDPERRIGSLVFNFGGPGESGVTGLPAFADEYTHLGSRYDLVSFDPRGVGNTIPVSCGDEDETDAAAYVEACEKNSGAVLGQVSTSRTARDMDLLREALGDKKLHYFGISYGTELGGVYAHLFPKNVGRMALDAVVDPTQDDTERALAEAEGFERALAHFMKDCAARNASCPTGPDPAKGGERVRALLERLEKKPVRTDDGREVNSDTALLGITNTLYSGKDGWESLAAALGEVQRDGTGDGLLEMADDYTGGGARTSVGVTPRAAAQPGNSDAALTAISCADSDQRLDYDEIDALVPRFEKASPIFGETSALALYTCTDWPVAGERTTPDVSAEGAPPILVIGNTGDPATPFEGSKRMAGQLGEGVGIHLTVEGEGHGTYGVSSCATRTTDAYLIDGKIPSDGKVCKA
ncbi:alpha/beta hydrolase [Streptomyces monticola]|uniref:Alpha/beta hydrolase n=1 Tax=Streptomyces monticola TaxID=2666263 RepID=A0ABW2JI28_9ACTN